MAGASRFHTATADGPLATPPPPPPASAVEQWDVAYSRFFNLPRRGPSSRPTTLRPLPKAKIRSTGTWISAASPASLILRRPRTASSAPVLSVSVSGKIHEEHFVSSLYFSWPQVSCVAECPVRGSRVVFVSFRDSSEQIQKFAVRFSACAAAEAFINSVKDCLRDTMDAGHPGSDFMYENSSASEFISSNRPHNSYDGESTYEEPIASIAPDILALTYNGEPERPLEPLCTSNVESVFSGLPPSFTDMLTSCTTDSEKEQAPPPEKTDLPSSSRACPPVSVADVAQQLVLMDETNLKAQITKYISDSSFHDMLIKIEKVIDELGGDMTL